MTVRIVKLNYNTYKVYTRPYWFMPWRWEGKFYTNATCLANAIVKANNSLDDLEIGKTYAEWKR